MGATGAVASVDFRKDAQTAPVDQELMIILTPVDKVSNNSPAENHLLPVSKAQISDLTLVKVRGMAVLSKSVKPLGQTAKWTIYIFKNCNLLIKINKTGAGEPNAQGCAFAHPLFEPQVKKMLFLRTQNLGLSCKLHIQY